MRRGITLIELTLVLVIIGVLCALGVPKLLRFIDRSRVRHATNEIVSALAMARTGALARQAHVTVLFDPDRSSVTVTAGADTIVDRELGVVYGVAVRSNRDSTVYGPTGLGYGAANQTVIVRRGSAEDSVVISRLGRVRR